jgi:2-oxoglutarate ferredoxin oxidoreductase subunit beta
VEIYQNCNIFNDDAFEPLKNPATRDDYLIRLEHGSPITFGAAREPNRNDSGADGQWCVVHPPGGFGLEVRETASVSPDEIVVHNATIAEPAYAFALSRLPGVDLRHTPIGVFRQVERPSYDQLVRDQLAAAQSTSEGTPEQQLAGLLAAGDTWTIN